MVTLLTDSALSYLTLYTTYSVYTQVFFDLVQEFTYQAIYSIQELYESE